jgi:hypothetical protein
VDVPVAIVVGESDTLHEGDAANMIVDQLPQGRLVTCPSSQYIHAADVLDDITRFLNSIER